jgi:hypothetical protein
MMGKAEAERLKTDKSMKMINEMRVRLKIPEIVKMMRNCLRCNDRFYSHGIGNRICPGCSNIQGDKRR